jgi:predicted nucleic acid-binding protein
MCWTRFAGVVGGESFRCANSYKKIFSQLHQLSVADVDNFLDGLAGLVTPVSLHFDWRPQLRDAGDEMVLQAAVNGHVDALVTHNVADFAMAKDRFNLTVWTPGTALKRLEQLELKEKYK